MAKQEPIPIFRGIVHGREIFPHAPEAFAEYLLKLEGQEVEVIIRKPSLRRSVQANKYYWSVVIPLLSEHCGYRKDEMHEILKGKFLAEEGTTTALSKEQFAEYLEHCIQFGAELDVYIPEPERVEV